MTKLLDNIFNIMKRKNLENLVYLLVLLTILLVGVIIYLVYKRKKYTRERFAFYSIFLFFSMGVMFISHVFSDNSFIIILYKLLNKFFDLQLEIPQTDWTGKLWSAFVYFIFGSVIFGIFKTWSGAKSEDDIKLLEMHKSMDFFTAVFKGFKNFNIKIVDKSKNKINDNDKGRDFTFFNISKDWHTQVKEIFLFISNQYQISEQDWHSEQNIFICKYARSDIAIFCCLNKPSIELIREKIDFFKDYYSDKRFKKLIISIQNNENKYLKEELQIDDLNIEIRYKNELLNQIVKFDEYFDYLKNEFEKKEITSGDNFKLIDVYVNQKSTLHLPEGLKKKKRRDIENTEEYILKWVNNNKLGKHIALLGEYGQGKSTLSLKVAYELIMSQSDRIPIIIELRGKSPKNLTLLEILASWSSQFNINAKAIEKLHEEGKLLVILEGFDEMDLVGDKYIRQSHFKRLVEFMRYEKSKVLITGRPNLFFDNNEMEEFLELNKDQNNLFYCNALILNPLDIKQIEIALRNVDEIIRREILDVLNDKNQNSNFKDLISRPSTLYQASIIWNSLDKNNINSASIINQFIKHSYQRQETKFNTIGRTGIESILTINEREYFTLGIAVKMIKNNAYSNQISNREINYAISELFFNIPDEVSKDHINGIKLQKRLEDDTHKIETIFNDVRASGILVKDLIKNHNFKFAHKSFLEYLFAFYFSNYIYQNDSYYAKVVNSISNAYKIQDIYKIKLTDEIIQFISELLIEQNSNNYTSKELVKEFLKIILPNKIFNLYPKIFVNKYFRLLTDSLIFICTIFIFINLITYDHTKFTGIYLVILIVFILLLIYLKNIISLKKITPALKIWYKTCSFKVSYDCIHSVICEKSVNSILDEKYINEMKEFNILFSEIGRAHV